MGIPLLRSDGTLPPGIHNAGLGELLMAYPMSTTYRRDLTDNLIRYLTVAYHLSIIEDAIIGGSFITTKAEPADIDLVVLAPKADPLTSEQKLREAGIDLLRLDVFYERTKERFMRRTRFFSLNRDNRPKGVIRLILPITKEYHHALIPTAYYL
jgi:hypothetical protein